MKKIEYMNADQLNISKCDEREQWNRVNFEKNKTPKSLIGIKFWLSLKSNN